MLLPYFDLLLQSAFPIRPRRCLVSSYNGTAIVPIVLILVRPPKLSQSCFQQPI